jgi:hypothetical protein
MNVCYNHLKKLVEEKGPLSDIASQVMLTMAGRWYKNFSPDLYCGGMILAGKILVLNTQEVTGGQKIYLSMRGQVFS